MSFFNRFSKKSEASQPTTETPNNWENLASNANFEAQAQLGNREAERAKNQLKQRERQERKLIDLILRGPKNLEQHDINISEQDRNLVYQELATGHLNDARKSSYLQQIATPFRQSPEKAIDRLNTKHERRILAYLSGTGFNYWESTSIYDLENTLERFPTPYELSKTEQSFLQSIKEHNSPQKYAQYQDAMESFKHKIYGKRYEYYNAMESLQQKADRKTAEDNSRTQVLNTYHQAPISSPEAATTTPELRRLSPQEQQEIIQQSQINGDQFIYNNAAYQLTPDTLKDFGLAPKYSFQLENATINLSDPYNVDRHSAVTAYVQTDRGTNIYSYYRSNSQGIWRLLPDYVANTDNPNRVINWFGKGYSEESLNLPSETQAMLEQISSQNTDIALNPVNAEFAFAGTAKRYNSREEWRQHYAQHTLRGQHYSEVSSVPSFSLGQLSHHKTTPESLDLAGPNSPDFSKSQNPYTTNTGLYGQIYVEHLPALDNSLQYTFNRNSNGEAWLGGIEVKHAPISSAGLRTEWASAGDYGTPLYEYTKQSGGYGNPNDSRGNYTNMWRNYLSRMPLIRKYLASRPQR